MAGSGGSAQEKTEDASPQQIERAKEEGRFARSKEITLVATFMSALGFLWVGQDYLIERALFAGQFFFDFDKFLDISVDTTGELFAHVLFHFFPFILPLFLLVFVTALAAEISQIGFRMVKEPFEAKWDKLNPINGLKRTFSMKMFAEGVKTVLKLIIFTSIIFMTIRDALPLASNTMGIPPLQGLKIMIAVALKIGLRISLLLIVLAGFDYWFQRWQYFKGLRMSHEEVKREQKEREGDPLLKQRIRQVQMEIARKRMMQDVPTADFILTNPTHYAVAIKYDPDKSPAPMVVAKGQNFIAERIREIARKEGIPLVENPPLAREIYKKTEVGSPIPAHLFKAVAQIMASIWQLAAKRGAAWGNRGNPVKQTQSPQPSV